MDRLGNLALGAVAVERDGIVIGRDDFGRVHRHGQFRGHRAGTDAIGTDALFAQFHRLLLGQCHDTGLGRAIGHPQGGRAKPAYRRDVDDGAAGLPEGGNGGLAHQEVAVEIRGDTAQGAYRVPVASLTSRDQVWVVEDGSLRQRAVEVIGGDNTVAVVREFDTADGVVAIPPANSRDGLPVVIQSESRVAGGGSVSVGAK